MSDRHDAMPGELRIVICGETLYHLLARTLKLMMQDAHHLCGHNHSHLARVSS